MLALILIASTNFLFSCNEADGVVLNVWQNPHLSEVAQRGIIDSVLEATPPECSAHFYDSTDE